MAGKHDVYILAVDGEYRARPAVAAVDAGRNMTFRNLTPHPVVVIFPSGLLKATASAQSMANMVVLPPNSRGTKAAIEQQANGAYSYAAWVVEQTQTASGVSIEPVPVKGESGPKIIVDP